LIKPKAAMSYTSCNLSNLTRFHTKHAQNRPQQHHNHCTPHSVCSTIRQLANHRNNRFIVAQSVTTPGDAASWDNTNQPSPDSSSWSQQPYDSEDELEEELAYLEQKGGGGGSGGPGFFIQNTLAAVLIGIFVVSAGALIWKLLIVGFALVSAAVRYSIVGTFLIILLAYFI